MIVLSLWRQAVAAFAACMIAAAALAQSNDGPRPVKILPDGQPTRINRIADIPPPLQEALEQYRWCRMSDLELSELPIVIFQPARSCRPMALVPCGAIIYSSVALIFERGLPRTPNLMTFPVVAQNGGFTSSTSPGLLTWEPSTKMLVGYQGNDMLSGNVHRHTYRHVGSLGLNGFAPMKFEYGKMSGDGPYDWQVLWEAQPWVIPHR